MAQFFINLPNGRQGNVRTSIKRKEQKTLLHVLMPWKKLDKEEKFAYIVEVNPTDDLSEYRLLKTKGGRWLTAGEDSWLREGNDRLNVAIKKAIDHYENNNTKKTA